MIFCKELNREFENKEDLFKELKLNEDKIISLKKAQKYQSAKKGQLSFNSAFLKNDVAEKAGLIVKNGFVYPVINTTRYMDHHDDVHFDGIWKKTLKEQVNKIYYVSNHSFKLDDVIAWPEDVRAFTALIDWSFVGKDYEGKTEALIYEIEEDKIQNDNAIKAIKQRRKVQGSVSMIYVIIKMAIDSKEKEYATNKAYYDSHIDLIVNKEEVKDQGYFFGVEEAKIYKEGSLVLAGSNDATEIIYPETETKNDTDVTCQECGHKFDYNSISESGIGYVKCPECDSVVTQEMKSDPLNSIRNENTEPLDDTQKQVIEPPEGTRKEINYKLLEENFKLKI